MLGGQSIRGVDEASLQRLLDREAIIECKMRWARGLDRLDEELIRSAFHDDALDYHGPVNGTVDEFLAWFMPRQGGREVAQHYVMNQSIDLDGDVAHVETYWMVVVKFLGDPNVHLMGGRHADRFERRHGEWKIAHLRILTEWQCTADGSQATEWLDGAHQGSRDRDDPTYKRPLAVSRP
jgi:hypothetical protein